MGLFSSAGRAINVFSNLFYSKQSTDNKIATTSKLLDKSIKNFSEKNILETDFESSIRLDTNDSQFNVKRRVSDQSSTSTINVEISNVSDLATSSYANEDDKRTSYSSSIDTLNENQKQKLPHETQNLQLEASKMFTGLKRNKKSRIPSKPVDSPTPSGQHRQLFRSFSDSHSFESKRHHSRSPEPAEAEPTMPTSPRLFFSSFSPRTRTTSRDISDSRRSSIVEHDVDLETYQQHISSEQSSYALAMSFMTQATPTPSINSVPSIVVEEEVSEFDEPYVNYEIGFSSKNRRTKGSNRTRKAVRSSPVLEDAELNKSSLRRIMSLNDTVVIERKYMHFLEDVVESSGKDSLEVHDPREFC
ncbi:hypothetical protein HK096_010522 [Nowakowskiella sp. JEL0078]|nr:hypothetical protein HK096_010522 [Nowakowskiella sp. JEL0078]